MTRTMLRDGRTGVEGAGSPVGQDFRPEGVVPVGLVGLAFAEPDSTGGAAGAAVGSAARETTCPGRLVVAGAAAGAPEMTMVPNAARTPVRVPSSV